MREWIENLIIGAFFVGLVYLFILGLGWYFSIPDVYFSLTTHECVGVIDSDGEPQPCDPLPEHYHKIWVR